MTVGALDPNFIHVVCLQLTGQKAVLHLKLDATVNDLMLAYQKEIGLHPAFQNPLSGHRQLRDIKIFPLGLNTKLSEFVVNPRDYIVVHIVKRPTRCENISSGLYENYFNGLSEYECHFKAELIEEMEKLVEKLGAEFKEKTDRLPSQKKYESDHPNSNADDYVTYVNSDAYHKLLDALATDEFMHPSKALKVKVDAFKAKINATQPNAQAEANTKEKPLTLEEEKEKKIKLEKEKKLNIEKEKKLKAEAAEREMWTRIEFKKKKRQLQKQKKLANVSK